MKMTGISYAQNSTTPPRTKTSSINTMRYVVLPKPTGPFHVGTKMMHVEDPSRISNDSQEKRHWMIQVYFPTNPPQKTSILRQRGTYPYAPNHLKAGKVQDTFVESFASPYAGPLDNWPEGFPVMILAPSLSFDRFAYTFLAEEFASYGMFVLVMDTPGVTSLVNFNDAKIQTPKLWYLWQFYHDATFHQHFIKTVGLNYQIDLQWIMNNLKLLAQFLNVTFDLTRIVLFGHAEGAAALKKIIVDDSKASALIEYYPTSAHNSHMQPPATGLCAKPVLTFYAIDSTQHQTPEQFTTFRFAFNTIQDKSNQYIQFSNQEIIETQGQKDAITDFGYLSYAIPALRTQTTFSAFLNWFFKTMPNFDPSYLNVAHHDPQQWVEGIRFTIITWLQKNNFIPHV